MYTAISSCYGVTMHIDHEDTEYPTCPYCGYVFDGIDPSEWATSTTTDCNQCGKLFRCEADYQVSYYTFKTDEPVDKSTPWQPHALVIGYECRLNRDGYQEMRPERKD